MKRNQVSMIIAAMILAAALAPASTMAAGKCDAPQNSVDKRACAKAAQGAVALRQFVWRTRMIYALNFADFAPYVPAEPSPANGVPVAASSH
jgi:hypothetical protein